MNRISLLLILFLPLPIPAHAEPTKVIHILNWHYVSRDDYAADPETADGAATAADQETQAEGRLRRRAH